MSRKGSVEVDNLLNRAKGLDIHSLGEKVVLDMNPEDRAKLRSMCGSLHFVKLLKLNSCRADRMVKDKKTKVSYKAVGIVLYSDVDIEVPDIAGHFNIDTGIPKEEIKSRKVKAGEEFYLTYYEYMFLMFRPEYAGYCTRDNDPEGVYFSAKMPRYLKNETKLPTPTVNFRKAGSPKETMEEVDYFDKEAKRWRIRPEYADKFGSLIKSIDPMRNQTGTIPTSTKAAIGLSTHLKEKFGYDNI